MSGMRRQFIPGELKKTTISAPADRKGSEKTTISAPMDRKGSENNDIRSDGQEGFGK